MPKISISFKGVACIYAVLSPSNKIYIGQTWCLYSRYKSGVSKSQRLLYRSYKKYGEENHRLFTIVEFKGVITQADLDYWEKYYIEIYKSEGYQMLNIREGGGNNGKLSSETKELLRQRKNEWVRLNPEKQKEITAAACAANRGKKRDEATKQKQSLSAKEKIWTEDHKRNISLAKKGKPSPHKGKHFSSAAVENIRKGVKTRNQKKCPIVQYSLQGEFIKEWPSIKEAANELNLHIGTIGGCIRKKPNYKTCGGFIWQYKTDTSSIIPEDHIQTYNPKKSAILQKDLQGNFIAEFETIKEAANLTGINRTNIIKCCRNTRKSAGGYIWQYR